MKSNHSPRGRESVRLLTTLILLAIAAGSRAEGTLQTIEVQGRFIYASPGQMKAALAAAKLPERPTAPLSPEQFEAVRRKLKNLRLAFFSQPQALTMSGQKAIVDAGQEFRYPTRFDPTPPLGQSLQTAKMFPAAFEMRKVGVTLEFTGVVAPDGFIDLTLDAEVTNFLGFIDKQARKPAPPGGTPILEDLLKVPLTKGGPWQPVFSSFNRHLKIELPSGQTVFFGGPMKVEFPTGVSALRSGRPDQQIFVFVSAKATSQNNPPDP